MQMVTGRRFLRLRRWFREGMNQGSGRAFPAQSKGTMWQFGGSDLVDISTIYWAVCCIQCCDTSVQSKVPFWDRIELCTTAQCFGGDSHDFQEPRRGLDSSWLWRSLQGEVIAKLVCRRGLEFIFQELKKKGRVVNRMLDFKEHLERGEKGMEK